VFNFDEIPTVVGGPYEYGVPGAVHGVFKEPGGGREPAHAGGGHE
jgi:cytochrome c oxidase subunit 1